MDKIKEILYRSFKRNKYINFLIGNDEKNEKRFSDLLDYSIDKAYLNGCVYYDEEKQSTALLINHSKSRSSVKSTLLDIKLIIKVIGLKNLRKVLKRESRLKALYPKTEFLHLWYIGVHPDQQGRDFGSRLLNKIKADHPNMDINIETSNLRNIPFYLKNSFNEIGELDLGEYQLKRFKSL